jgi:hypothetical protein
LLFQRRLARYREAIICQANALGFTVRFDPTQAA